MRNPCDVALIASEMAALSFQANADYGTWSIDFDVDVEIRMYIENDHLGYVHSETEYKQKCLGSILDVVRKIYC